MLQNTQQRIVALKNELKSQKTASGLAFSQLLMPENTPTQSYSGTASTSGGAGNPVARVRFRFERTDGLIEPPMINFAYDATFSPDYKQFASGYGWTFSGAEDAFLPQDWVAGYIAELGDGYVDFYVDFTSDIRTDFFSLQNISLSTTCQAITNVKGILWVERII